MKKTIKNSYKFILGLIFGLVISITTVYAVNAYIESNKVTYKNNNKSNVQEAIDELYERSGIHQDKWIDPILNGADPVLKEPLIPVEIKPNGDVYYASENSEWYNYKEKRWANAIILIDNPSNENYQAGDHIIEDDIESYFVWIPRFKYKVWDKGNYSEVINFQNIENVASGDTAIWKVAGSYSRLIDIVFGNSNYVKAEGDTKQGSGISGGDADVNVGDYLIHPAFTLGGKNLNGLWVAKFETGKNGDNLISKPNVNSWRAATIRTFYDAAKGYESTLDSHMMKNTEWGATAYLSHSKYGIGNKININNNSSFVT